MTEFELKSNSSRRHCASLIYQWSKPTKNRNDTKQTSCKNNEEFGYSVKTPGKQWRGVNRTSREEKMAQFNS